MYPLATLHIINVPNISESYFCIPLCYHTIHFFDNLHLLYTLADNHHGKIGGTPTLLLNQPIKVNERLANALLLITPHSDLVNMTRVNPTIHQTLWQVFEEVLKSSVASIASPHLCY